MLRSLSVTCRACAIMVQYIFINLVGDALTNCLKHKCIVPRNACDFQYISDVQSCWTGFLQQWGAECSPLSRGTFKLRPKMSGKMSMASRLGCPAERRRVVTVHTYRPIGMCPIRYKYLQYPIMITVKMKLQLYYWLTNPQVTSVVFQLKRHPTYTVGKRDCLSLAQEKILSNQIDSWHSTKTAQY